MIETVEDRQGTRVHRSHEKEAVMAIQKIEHRCKPEESMLPMMDVEQRTVLNGVHPQSKTG